MVHRRARAIHRRPGARTDPKTLSQLLAAVDAALEKARPEVYATLRPGAAEPALERLSREVLAASGLPQPLREWFGWHDGQTEVEPLSLESHRTLLSIDQAIDAWKMCGQPFAMKPWSRTWIPLLENGAGDYLVYETSGADRGALIGYSHEDRSRKVEHEDLRAWAKELLRELTSSPR